MAKEIIHIVNVLQSDINWIREHPDSFTQIVDRVMHYDFLPMLSWGEKQRVKSIRFVVELEAEE